MNSVPIVPDRLDWPSAIGNFILNFGTLDYFIFVFLKDHLTPEEFVEVRKWHFKDRVNRIARFLQEQTHSEEQRVTFARLSERLKPLRELRNHIAHGHLYGRVNPTTHQLTVTLFTAKDLDTGFLPEAKHVELAELQSALAQLADLTQEFERLVGFVDAKDQK